MLETEEEGIALVLTKEEILFVVVWNIAMQWVRKFLLFTSSEFRAAEFWHADWADSICKLTPLFAEAIGTGSFLFPVGVFEFLKFFYIWILEGRRCFCII